MIDKKSKIYIAGHTGMVGSSIVRKYIAKGYKNLILKTHDDLDLLNQKSVKEFFRNERPEYIILAAARVGGIKDNMSHQADYIYENLQIDRKSVV